MIQAGDHHLDVDGVVHEVDDVDQASPTIQRYVWICQDNYRYLYGNDAVPFEKTDASLSCLACISRVNCMRDEAEQLKKEIA